MADHITVVVSGGATRILQTTDNTTYHTPAHQIVNAAGTTTLGVFAEDAAHSSAHTGLMALGVRQDTAAALAGTDADYMPFIFTSTGKLWTDAAVSAVIPGTGATNLGKAEDGAHTSADVGVMALAVRTDTAANRSGTDGDYEPLQISAGRLWTSTTVDAALPAGTNAIGKLAANSGVDIGDVDITSIVPGTGATNLGKAEDGAHTSGDVGVMMLGVRNDTHSTALAGTDADYTPIGVDSSGKIGIRGTFAEDAAHTSADLGIFVLAVRSDTAASTGGTDGDYVALITDSAGKLHVNVGAVTPGTAATSLGKIEDAAHSSGDVGVMALAVANSTHTNALVGTDADYCPIAVDTTGKIGIRGTFAEDAAHTTADLGIFTLAVRNDSDAAAAGTDLDYSYVSVDSTGRQKVNMVQESVVVDVTPVCDTSAYTANDVLFDRITTGTIARVTGGTVILDSVIVLDEDDQTAAAMDLYFLDSDVTLGTINNAVSISDANARKIVGWVAIAGTDFKDTINSKVACIKNIGLHMKCAAGSQVLYVAGTTAGTPTQTADGIKLKLAFRKG